MSSDIPTDLEFVDPHETVPTYRVMLWGAAGEGKSVAAASAPGPILVLSADRPTAYRFARKHHAPKVIRETRFKDVSSLETVFRYLRSDEGKEIRTVVVDPISNVVEAVAETAPLRDGDTDYQWVNRKVAGFVKALRAFDVNLVLVAYEKLNDGKRGDGKLYPAAGGPALTLKLLGEMDIVAHIERHVVASDDGEETVRWVGQIQPRGNLVGKDSTDALGERRIADLTRWFEVADDAYAIDNSDLPFDLEDGQTELDVGAEPESDEPASALLGEVVA